MTTEAAAEPRIHELLLALDGPGLTRGRIQE